MCDQGELTRNVLITDSDRVSGQSCRYQHMTPVIRNKFTATEGIGKNKRKLKRELRSIGWRIDAESSCRWKTRHLVVSVSVLK